MCIGGWTGIHFGLRLEEANQCILVIIGAAAEGKKKLVVLADGFRESESSWKETLLDLKRRGLTIDPKLAVGDGALGFWKALPQMFGETRVQRCWVHKSANVLNKLPKHLQPKVKSDLHQIWMADTRENTYQPKYPKAIEGTKELPRSTLKRITQVQCWRPNSKRSSFSVAAAYVLLRLAPFAQFACPREGSTR